MFNREFNLESYNLGEEQLSAFLQLKDFISKESSSVHISLVGAAGTGKTKTISAFIDYLESIDMPYIVAAPTHKAKLVLETYTKQKAYTIHQMLALQPNLDIFELDLRELDFLVGNNKSKNQIPYKGVVIVDEASMINDDLFDCLVDCISKNKSKIIFLGDIKQLCPVKSDKLSKVFTLSNIINLTKIYRQKEESPVLDLLTILRDKPLYHFETVQGKEDSIYVYNKAIDFVKSAKDILKETIETCNVLHSKFIVYTNSRVSAMNEVARKLIFGKAYENEFNVGEILTGYDNLEYNNFTFYNSLDYIVKHVDYSENINLPHFSYELKGYKLLLYDTVYKVTNSIVVLSKNNDPKIIEELAKTIENIRITAVRLKKSGKSSFKYWDEYYRLTRSFATTFDLYFNNRIIKKKTFDYGYAITAFKAQGSSFDTVFVDIKNINICQNEEILRQMQYVAISRTKGNVYLLV